MSGRYLIDTNVLSELSRSHPHGHVEKWLRTEAGDAFLSVITVAEHTFGIEQDRDLGRAARVRRWFDEQARPAFADRMLDVSELVAVQSGSLRAAERRAGRVLSVPDALIAATAVVHGLTLATRNTRDFASLGISLVNPWEWQAP